MDGLLCFNLIDGVNDENNPHNGMFCRWYIYIFSRINKKST